METGTQEDSMALLSLLPGKGPRQHEMLGPPLHGTGIPRQNLKARDSQSCPQSEADMPTEQNASASQLWENGKWHRGTYSKRHKRWTVWKEAN